MSRTRMETRAPVREGEGTSNVPTFEDQIRSYRNVQRIKHQAGRQLKRIRGQHNRSLESRIDPDAQLQISRSRRSNMVPAEVLYDAQRDNPLHRVYQHYSERRIRVTEEGEQEDLRFITDQSYRTLREEGFQHIHLGLMMVRVHGLHARHAGTQVLVVLRDTRWPDERQVIGTMEIDMSTGTQLVYVVPDLMLSVEDFYEHIQLAVQTRGYEGWQGESNLIITTALVGRLTNTSYASFRYNVQNVAEHLASNGIQAIPGQPRMIDQGERWELRVSKVVRAQAPREVHLRQRSNGNISFRFSNYAGIPRRQPIQVNDRDEEQIPEDEEEFVGAILEEVEEPQENKPWWHDYDPDLPKHWGTQCDGCLMNPLIGTRWKSTVADQDFCTTCMGRYRELHGDYAATYFISIRGGNTLGQPSGKFDYHVKYTIPDDWQPVEQAQIVASGWETDSSDESMQSQPKWDTSPDEQTEEEGALEEQEEESYDSFTEGGGEETVTETEETVTEIETETKTEADKASQAGYVAKEEELEMEYPVIQNMKSRTEHMAKSSASSPYRPPTEPYMGTYIYPPASGVTEASTSTREPRLPRLRHQGRDPSVNWWNLPPAQIQQGAMLILPQDIGMYTDVVSRWESITLNLVDDPMKAWSSNKQKISFIENLLGEDEKKIWQQWKVAYPEDYNSLEAIAEETQNVLSQIRKVFLLEVPYQGDLAEQNQAYIDLERLTCESTRDIWRYLNDFKTLAAKSGRIYFPETSEKLFRKMPPLIREEVEKAWNEKYPGAAVAVIPRIYFTYQYLSKMCKQAALQREIKDLSFCKDVHIPGYYKSGKRYGLRKAKTYKGKPHDTHVRVFKKKHADKVRKCKCFICGEEGHFARECKRGKGNISRAVVLKDLDIPDDYDVVSVDVGDPDSDGICSFSEGEIKNYATKAVLEDEFLDELAFVVTEGKEVDYGWRYKVVLTKEQERCKHLLEANGEVPPTKERCSFCQYPTFRKMRCHCKRCEITACPMCSKFYLEYIITPEPPAPKQYSSKDRLIQELMNYNVYLLAENERLQKIVSGKLIEELQEGRLDAEKFDKRKERGKGVKIHSPSGSVHDTDSSEEEIAMALVEEMSLSSVEKPTQGRKVINRLYNMVVNFNIPGVKPFSLRAILDTGATTCCVDKGAVPAEALEKSPYPVYFSGINSRQIADCKLKQGQMEIGENRFRIPFTYSFPMGMKDGIEMFTHSRVGLSARIAIKYFHSISDKLREQEEQLRTISATQKKIQKQLKSLEGELEQHRPLSRTDVQQLVKEIAQQPKLVEAEALKLTQDLERKLQEVKDLLKDVKQVLLS